MTGKASRLYADPEIREGEPDSDVDFHVLLFYRSDGWPWKNLSGLTDGRAASTASCREEDGGFFIRKGSIILW